MARRPIGDAQNVRAVPLPRVLQRSGTFAPGSLPGSQASLQAEVRGAGA